jgi:tetratricopeptide (TPR) repeat protein
MIYWWKIQIEPETEKYDEIFFEKIEETIDFCDELLDKNPDNADALFFKGGAIGFRGRLYVKRESWLKAANDGREALPIVEQVYKLNPKNIDVQLGFGIYNYLVAVIPESYPIVKPLMIFFPEGNKESGLKQLKNAAANGKYARYEARYFLMTVYSMFEKDNTSAMIYSNQLVNVFPDNPVFERWRGRIAVRLNDWPAADSIFRSVLAKGDKKLPGYNSSFVKREAYYYIAYNYKNLGKNDSAMEYFKKCIDLSNKIDTDEESGFLVNSTLYMGTLYEASGKYEQAQKYYEEVLDMREYGNSYELAETNLKRVEQLTKQNK